MIRQYFLFLSGLKIRREPSRKNGHVILEFTFANCIIATRSKSLRVIYSKASGVMKGYQETSHPNASARGHRTFENPNTGDKLRYDRGKPGAPGYQGRNHYHRYNPKKTSKKDQYLDKDGNPCCRGSNESHLFPGD